MKAVKKEVGGDYDNFVRKNNYQKLDVSAFYAGQIGELVHGLTGEFKISHSEISWKQIVDTKNILIHRYGTRDNQIIWDIICNDIPILNQYCRKILIERNSEAENEIAHELAVETNIDFDF